MENVELKDLKANEIRLRELLKKERVSVFKADIQWAYDIAKMRRIMAEQDIGVGVKS